MNSYYFIKYNQFTNVSHINKYAETKAIICFDFEDSIKDSQEKINHRKYFTTILNDIVPYAHSIKVGVRLNGNFDELQKDIEAIKNQKIHSILIPKVENRDQLTSVGNKLIEQNIDFNELIPIVESSHGLKNLIEIISVSSRKIIKIGFGHCDYNLSINSFPFFHQNTTQYWKWINEFNKILSTKNISFINSAYLDLDNLDFFKSTLNYLQEIFGENCGQFCLTTKQAQLVAQTSKVFSGKNYRPLLNYCYDLAIPKKIIKEIITTYEKDDTNKNFAISKQTNSLISPHEYKMAKQMESKESLKKIHFTFVGGCFPIQHNILFEDLFHQKLKKNLESDNNISFNINIIRYERFLTCLDKIKNYNSKNQIEYLVFHIRPEPFLRIIKFYYKYINNKEELKHSLNIPLLRSLNPEKYDIVSSGRQVNFLSQSQNSKFKKQLIVLNYRVGCLFGNRKVAQQKYLQLILSVIEYCKNNAIKLLIIGPPCRSGNKIEAKLSKELNIFMKNNLKKSNIGYIEGMVTSPKKENPYFNSNGIHATEAYHQYISDKLYERLMSKICN